MKIRIASAVLVILVVGGAFFAGRWSTTPPPRSALGPPDAPGKAASTLVYNRPPPVHPPAIVDWQKMRSVRDLTFEKNPDLAAEYKSLIAEIELQQNALDNAMIAADPKVAPIVAKLKALRHRNTAVH